MRKTKLFQLFVVQYILLILSFEIIPKGLVNALYVMEIGFFALLTFFYFNGIKRLMLVSGEGKLTYRAFVYFFVVALFFLAISYRDLTDYWKIPTLFFDKKYIPRHFIIIAQYFIAFGMGYCIYRCSFITRLRKVTMWAIMVFSILIVSFSFSSHSRAYTSIVLLMVSLLCVHNRKYIFLLLFLFPLFMRSSSYSIGLLLLILITFYHAKLAKYFSHHGKVKLTIFGFIIFLSILALSTVISEKVSEDGNSQWRLVVWINEMVSLARTKFTGVGFGSAYVSTEILKETTNLNMYTNNETKDFLVGIFIVGNHSSIVNMFYRMGLIGGFLFLLLNIRLLIWCIHVNERSSVKFRQYLWWAMANYIFNFIILAFNPGLEMVQFSIGYQLSLAILLAFLMKSSEIDNDRISQPITITNHNEGNV